MVLNKQVNIVLENNISFKNKYNQGKFQSCDFWPCPALNDAEGKRRETVVFLSLHYVEEKQHVLGYRKKLINRLEVIVYQQEVDSSS